MIEAMLWTMAEPLLATQLGTPAKPIGNVSPRHAPHGAWRCQGDDDWISIVARTDSEWRALCDLVPGLSGLANLDLGERRDAQRVIDAALTAWAGARPASAAAESLEKAGIPVASLARSGDLVKSPHLADRDFWDRHGAGVLPGLPWRASFGRTTGPAPELGADCDHVLANVLGLSQERIVELRTSGALG
jgi:crotonobetainyl-CoA:carnitine CoA-transferase CaiB-like acyl-CoA transferase